MFLPRLPCTRGRLRFGPTAPTFRRPAAASRSARCASTHAAVSYGKTYELTYHDPRWMESIAELRARQGRVDDAAKAVRTALVEGRPERADTFFAAARRLEQWRMLEAARPFVD